MTTTNCGLAPVLATGVENRGNPMKSQAMNNADRLKWWLVALGAGLSLAAQAAWPARVFAPYMYAGTGDHFKLTDCDRACGQKFYTLAFIIADPSNNPAWTRDRIPAEAYFNAYARIRGSALGSAHAGPATQDWVRS